MKSTDYKICIEAFVRWEQLTGRAFQTMDFESPDDLCQLLYCARLVANPDEQATYEVFSTALHSNNRFYKQAITSLMRYNNVVSQFTSTTQPTTAAESDKDSASSPTLGEAVARLIVVGGVDARFVMRDMSIADMLLLVKAIDDKQRQEAESARLWTYISVAPHIDQKKTPNPQKLYPFPWEAEQIKQKAIEVAESSMEEFEAFMRQTPKNKK